MAKKDLVNHISVARSLAPDQFDTNVTVNGASADMQNHQSAVIVLHVGVYTNGTHTFTIQESSDNSTFTAVAAANLEGSLPVVDAAGDANTVSEVGYRGSARYLRVSVTTAAATATNGAFYAAEIVRSHPRFAGASTFTANS